MKFKNIVRKIIFTAFITKFSIVNAQIYNVGNVMIHDQGVMHVANGEYYFTDSPANISSTRTLQHGVLSFGSSSGWNESINSLGMDGYVKTNASTEFIMPIADLGVTAHIKVWPVDSESVEGAYYRSNPSTISSNFDLLTIEAISTIEYWEIKAAAPMVSSKIALSWRDSSDISSLLLTPSIDYLTILGYNGSEWVEIPSFYDSVSFLGESSSLDKGSITSLNAVDLTSFQFFTIGSKKQAICYPAVVSSGIIKTWDGANWSPSEPGLSDPVIINAPYSGNLSCYSVVLNADITLVNGNKLDVVDGFSGSFEVNMASEASLLQRNSNATPPKIVMTKISNPMRRYDYVFLSSPIDNTSTFFDNILSAQNTAVNGEFGLQNNSAFNQLRTFNEEGLAPIDASPLNTPVGRGFSATIRNQAPYQMSTQQGSWNNQRFPIHIKTNGTANNGDINVNVPANGWVRIGNPYPSPINANKLLDAMGPNVRKTIYYWTFNTPRASLNNTNVYNNADFATFNYSGGVAACATCEIPTGIIATMQSVLTKAITGTGASTITLTNCLRDLNGNDDFFRNENESNVKGKFRLNLEGTEGSFSQILVAYDSVKGTVDFDNGFDAARLSGTSSEFSSLIQNNRYVIQTRHGFVQDDVVPLQIDKRKEESFTISLATKEGVFNNIPIYLHDITLGVFHDLTVSNYNFVHDDTDLFRFEIVYQNALHQNDWEQNNVVAFIAKNQFQVQANENIENIQLFDLSGRLIFNYNTINQLTFKAPFNFPDSVYLAKIKLSNGFVLTQKLINTK
jgi:hypothetical protein